MVTLIDLHGQWSICELYNIVDQPNTTVSLALVNLLRCCVAVVCRGIASLRTQASLASITE